MSESTLAAQFKDLQADVGFFLGYGRGPLYKSRHWTQKQEDAITRSVKGGMRRFYFCGHTWSFLHPISEIAVALDADRVIMPDDFGGMESYLVLGSSDGSGLTWSALQQGGISQVDHAQSTSPDSSGRPSICCVETIKESLHGQGPRSQIRFWPKANAAYTIKAQYYILPDYLSGEKPFAYGGAEHAETLLEACLAIAEKIIDDRAELHAMEFEKLLMVSKELDARKKSRTPGYNGDWSDQIASGRGLIQRHADTRVTFQGVQH